MLTSIAPLCLPTDTQGQRKGEQPSGKDTRNCLRNYGKCSSLLTGQTFKGDKNSSFRFLTQNLPHKYLE